MMHIPDIVGIVEAFAGQAEDALLRHQVLHKVQVRPDQPITINIRQLLLLAEFRIRFLAKKMLSGERKKEENCITNEEKFFWLQTRVGELEKGGKLHIKRAKGLKNVSFGL